MDLISFEDFKKIDLRVAKVLAAERVEGSDKLLRLEIDIGEDPPSQGTVLHPATEGQGKRPAQGLSEARLESNSRRQLVAGIGKKYALKDIIGKEIIIVANLEPKAIMGLESRGMLLAADGEDGPVLLVPDKEIDPGTLVR